MIDFNTWRQRGVVYTVPGMDAVQVQRDIVFTTTADGMALTADIFQPALLPATPLPAVIFVSGDAAPEAMRNLKDSSQYQSWGQLVAALGMIGVTFNHRSSEGLQRLPEVEQDVLDLWSFVQREGATFGIDISRLALWTCSGGPPFALRAALRDAPPEIRAIIVYYGMLDLAHLAGVDDPPEAVALLRAYSPVAYLAANPAALPPLLIARAGHDHPRLNEAVDRFVAEALALNLAINIFNHPQGRHAFDTLDDDPRSRAIIRATLDFLQEHLASSSS
jgi:acetyl esterase/lipase